MTQRGPVECNCDSLPFPHEHREQPSDDSGRAVVTPSSLTLMLSLIEASEARSYVATIMHYTTEEMTDTGRMVERDAHGDAFIRLMREAIPEVSDLMAPIFAKLVAYGISMYERGVHDTLTPSEREGYTT